MKIVYKLATLLTGVLLGVLVSLIATKLLEDNLLNHQLRLSALENDSITGMQQTVADEQKRISSAILIDSILTIIQNYYVDSERSLDNRSLVVGALNELSHYRGVKVNLDNLSEVLLTVDDMVYEFTLEENYTFPKMLEDSIQIALFLEKTKLKERLNTGRYGYIGENIGSFVYLNAMLHSLDPHSSLLDQEEYRELKQGTEGSFGGLGVVVGIQDDILTVIKPLPHSPAEKAGISGRDQITFINNTSTFGTSLQSLVHHMRGAPGTEVDLSLLRSGEVAPRKIKIKREIIKVNSLNSKVLKSGNHNLLSLVIDSFSSRTADEIEEAIIEYKNKENIKGLILDLRGNPGGLLDQSVKAADLFLKKGRIVSTSGRRPEVEIAYNEGNEFQDPIIILVNGETASASEILAGALQDNNRAIVLGQPTFGKGSVQTVFELPSNQALKLTIARYYSPNGKTIQNSGIMPDVWLQPVERNKNNINLLGSGRYMGERFLSNRLSGSGIADLPNSRFKFFYLNNDDFDFEEFTAVGILNDLIDKNGYPMPEDRRRATFWLANSSDYLNRSLKKEDQKVNDYFNQFHDFSWSDSESIAIEKNPKMRLTLTSGMKLSVKEGQIIKIPWELKNYEDEVIDKISIFIRSHDGIIEPIEKIVGTVKRKGKLSGEVELKISFPSEDQSYRFYVGYSLGGWPVLSQQKELKLNVRPSKRPEISFDLDIVEEIGGEENGILEPGESAVLQVNLKNNSNINAHNVSADLVSFSGKQVSLGKDFERNISSLKKGEQISIRFPIDVSKKLVSKGLHFGLTVDAEEYLEPMKKSYLLKAVPKRR